MPLLGIRLGIEVGAAKRLRAFISRSESLTMLSKRGMDGPGPDL